MWRHDDLQNLSLRSTSLTDADAVNLAALTQLAYLDLCHTPITDDVVETLSILPNLTSLRLEGTHVTAEAATRLRQPPMGYYGREETWAPAPSEEQRQIAAALERGGARVDVHRKKYGSVPEYTVVWSDTALDDELTRLWLSDVRVTEAGLESLRKLPRLESCWVNDRNVIDSPMVPAPK